MRTVLGPPRSASEGIWAVGGGGGHRTASQVYTSVQRKTAHMYDHCYDNHRGTVKSRKHKSDCQNQNYKFNVHTVVLPYI